MFSSKQWKLYWFKPSGVRIQCYNNVEKNRTVIESTFPVSTRRRLDVDTTLFERQQLKRRRVLTWFFWHPFIQNATAPS